MHSFPKLCMYLFLSNKKLFACTFSAEFRGSERKFGSCMRTTTMEYPKGPTVMKRNSEVCMSAWEMLRRV
jgi:hypothetical protein